MEYGIKIKYTSLCVLNKLTHLIEDAVLKSVSLRLIQVVHFLVEVFLLQHHPDFPQNIEFTLTENNNV